MHWLRDKLKEFFADPIGTASEWFVYIIMLGVAIFLLIMAGRWLWEFLGAAVR